jgi:uncharacterized lipoprotein YbaY
MTYNNSSHTPMSNVTLTLSPGGATCTTDGTGHYSFPGLCVGTYSIAVTNNNKPVGGINSTDAVSVALWAVCGGSIEHVKFLSGDVNNDNTITWDPLRILLYFAREVAFDRAPWSYWKKGDFVRSNAIPAPIPTSFSVFVAADIPNYDLLAQCTGDFNGSFTPNAAKSMSSSLALNLGNNVVVGTNQEFELPLRAVSTMDVSAVSMILDIPSNLLEVTGITVNGSQEPATYAVKGNELRIGWSSVAPVTVPAEGTLLTLHLKTTDAFTVGRSISLNLVPDPLNELADAGYSAIDGAVLVVDKVDNGILGVSTQTGSNKLGLSNYPNPFSKSTKVTYEIPSEGRVTLELHTMLGQLSTILVDKTQDAGKYTVDLNGSNLQQGIYSVTLRLKTSQGQMVRTIKLIVNQQK